MKKIFFLSLGIVFILVSFLACDKKGGERSAPTDLMAQLSKKYDFETMYKIEDSLTRWGEDIDPQADKIFKIGAALMKKKRFEDSSAVFEYLLKWCAQNAVALKANQYNNILLRIAYNKADTESQPRAIEIYKIMIALLKSEAVKDEIIPENLVLLPPDDEETKNELLGMNLLDLMCSETVVQDWKSARIHMEESVALLIQYEGYEYKVINNFRTYANNAKAHGNIYEESYANMRLKEIEEILQ